MRRTALKRSAHRREPQPPPRNTGPDEKTRELVRGRFADRCVRCGGPGETIQHRDPRGLGGTVDPAINLPSNLLFVCGDGVRGCHGYMESYRTQACAAGWLVRDGEDPAEVPVLTWTGARVLLDDIGGYRSADPDEGLIIL